ALAPRLLGGPSIASVCSRLRCSVCCWPQASPYVRRRIAPAKRAARDQRGVPGNAFQATICQISQSANVRTRRNITTASGGSTAAAISVLQDTGTLRKWLLGGAPNSHAVPFAAPV